VFEERETAMAGISWLLSKKREKKKLDVRKLHKINPKW
jgi:hypothetical protein